MKTYLALVLGVFACATSVIFIRLSEVEPVLLSSYRTLVAALFLMPVFIGRVKKHRAELTLGHFRCVFWPALALALHFISWTMGARLAPATNATLIVNTAPLVMPFFLYLMMREVVNRQEIIGTLVAFSGVMILAGGDFTLSPEYLLGDLICLGSMVMVAFYFCLARLNRDFPSIWLYLVPVYGLCGILCLLAAVVLGVPPQPLSLKECLLMLALGCVPTIIGHSLINYSMQQLRGQIVSVANIGQFFFAGLMALLIFGEWPSLSFYLACPLVLIGAFIAIWKPHRGVMRPVESTKPVSR
jgi:drug/metabolite transporter (DMT)-like permease